MADRIKKLIKITKKNPSQILECIIKKHIDNYKSLYDILEIETQSNLKLKKAIKQCYINYIKTTKQVRTLYDYQIKYIDNAITELLINNKCIVKSPTGSGKTLICFNIIANIYRHLSENDTKEIKHFNVIFLTPRLKLCAQSIYSNSRNKSIDIAIETDKDDNIDNRNTNKSDINYINNTELLSINGVVVKYLEYNSKVAKKTQEEIFKNPNFNFISSTYQSLDNLVDFIEAHKIPIDLIVYDEFHYIYNWKSGTKTSKKFIENPLFAKKLFLSATPYKKQEENIELYGKLLNFVSIKELIEAGHLCTLEPMVEIDLDENNDDGKDFNRNDNSIAKYKKLPQMLNEGFTKYNKQKAIIFCNTTKNCYDLYDNLNNELNVGKLDGDDKYIKIFQPYVGMLKNKLLNISTNNTLGNILNEEINNNSDDSENTNEANELMEIETNITDENIKTINKVLEEYEKYTKQCILITCKKIDLGYDHKPIDFVIIADNKQSYIDLAQSIGRGIRKYNQNKICHVLLPIKLKDIREGNFKSAINYLEYIKNDVQYDIVSKIIKPSIDKSRISKLMEVIKKLNIPIDENKISYEYLNNLLLSYKNSIEDKIYSAPKESDLQQTQNDNKETQNLVEEIEEIQEVIINIEKDYKILRDTWIQIYEELAIRNSSNIRQNEYDIKKLKYTLLQDKIKLLNFKNKIEYKSWALENEEIPDPENEFKGTIWTNYYDFLNIKTDGFPKTCIEWELVCKKDRIFDCKTYYKYFEEKHLPEMPEELYGNKLFGNLHARLQKLKSTLVNEESDNSDIE